MKNSPQVGFEACQSAILQNAIRHHTTVKQNRGTFRSAGRLHRLNQTPISLTTPSIQYRLIDMAGNQEQDPVMVKVRARFESSGLSLHDLGMRMGYPVDSARKSAWQFIQKTDDPRLSMLRRFAKAMQIPL